MSILAILNELANEPSINAKVAILQREKGNTTLKAVFEAAYNPMVTYGIKQIPVYKATGDCDLICSVFAIKEHLASRLYTGSAASNFLQGLLEESSEDDAIVLERIIQRDLRCGTSDSLASRVWAGLVPTFDVMLAHKDISGIHYPAFAQCLSGNWCVETPNGKMTIQQIVEHEGNPQVLSFDHITRKNEFKRVVNVSKNKTKKRWFVLTLSDGTITEPITGNHEVWSENRNEYVKVEDLSCSDIVQIKTDDSCGLTKAI